MSDDLRIFAELLVQPSASWFYSCLVKMWIFPLIHCKHQWDPLESQWLTSIEATVTQLPEGTVCDAAAAERCCWEHLQLPVGLFHYREFSGVPGTEQKIVPWSSRVFSEKRTEACRELSECWPLCLALKIRLKLNACFKKFSTETKSYPDS